MKQAAFETGRIGALSDGVFAIAMTLLVLELKLPELGPDVGPKAFNMALMKQGTGVVSWLLSFAILCRLWITQHALLKGDAIRSRGFTTWNFVFLGAVSLVPFPTSLLSEHHDQAASVAVFSLVLAVAGVALGAMWNAERRVRVEGRKQRSAGGSVVALLVVAALAGGLAFVDPKVGILVWITYPIGAAFLQHRHAAKQRSDGGDS